MPNINARIRNKVDTSANWTSNNPVLLAGELVVVKTENGATRFKIGDGTKTYTQLPFTDEPLYNALSDKAPADHTHTAEDVGARPDTWMPTATDVGAVIARKTISSGSIKDIAESGKYLIDKAVTDMPIDGKYWIVDASVLSSNHIELVAYQLLTDGVVYVQSNTNGNWYGWRQIYTTANKPSAADVGARSLNDMELIPTGADLNSYLTPGSYRCALTGIAATLSNTPVTSLGFTLNVEWISGETSGNWMMQELHTSSSDVKIYYRVYRAGVWYDWKELFTTAGGTLTGDLTVQKNMPGFYAVQPNNGGTKVFKNANEAVDFGTIIQDDDKNGNFAHLVLEAFSGMFKFANNNGSYYAYHTGNIITGSSTFNGTSGRAISHSLGSSFTVSTMPTSADAAGNLGDVYVVKGNNTVTIYNTGSYRGAFDYTIIKR